MTLLKQEGIILNSMTQTGNKWGSLVLSRGDFWMTWTCHGIPCFHFHFFSLETTLLESTWMKTTSVAVMVFFSSKMSFRKYLITAMFKVFYQQLRSILTTAFERHLTTEDFTDMGVKPAPRHLIYYLCFSFSQTSPVFKFNLMLVE